jgi:hypothetical protein
MGERAHGGAAREVCGLSSSFFFCFHLADLRDGSTGITVVFELAGSTAVWP